ncbi:DUF29 domain-containing protein [Tumidithrix helvetica PCC 7403]|uniref:DUF29 domain-containing protein n=1 Tax=Tumidithrix helvetica TaxID=3457545 RepID=UPI003C818153
MTSLQSKLNNNLQSSLYDLDYVRWIENTVEKLRNQNYTHVDWENLIEEVADMGKSERRSLKSNAIVLLVHLLKWQFQPLKRTGSWERSIIEHRRRIGESLQDSPSLKPYLAEIFMECYQEAVLQAKAETGLASESFPSQCPYELQQIMERGFLP